MKRDLTLGEFILAEMDKRRMSAREFALFVGVTHSTINKFVHFGSKDVGYPSIEFLGKLAQATHSDLCAVMALVFPEVTEATQLKPSTIILAQRIEQLPDAVREIIDGIIAQHVPKQP
jgi:transcriptional regulator with XRE-family HTH domain